MKTRLFIIVLSFTAQFCQGQQQNDIVLLTVRSDRYELAKLVKFINRNNPKLTCVNVDLFRCDQEKPDELFPNREEHFDSLTVSSFTYPSEAEEQLRNELRATYSLLMPSKIRPLGYQGYMEITGCAFLYSEETSTGFINLISNEDIANQVERFQVSLIDPFNDKSYHFATKIAFALNAEKTRNFINSHENVVKIDFEKKRTFSIYSFDDFVKNKINGNVLNDKIVIIGVGQPGDNFLIRKNESEKLEKMSASEIFANIACQIIGE